MAVCQVIIHPQPTARDRYGLVRNLAWRILLAAEALLLQFYPKHKYHYRPFDILQASHPKIEFYIFGTRSEARTRNIRQLQSKQLRALGIDLLVNCGCEVLERDVLEAARLGTIGFSRGHNGMQPGSPAGFWECYHRSPQTKIVVGQIAQVDRITPVLRRILHPLLVFLEPG